MRYFSLRALVAASQRSGYVGVLTWIAIFLSTSSPVGAQTCGSDCGPGCQFVCDSQGHIQSCQCTACSTICSPSTNCQIPCDDPAPGGTRKTCGTYGQCTTATPTFVVTPTPSPTPTATARATPT